MNCQLGWFESPFICCKYFASRLSLKFAKVNNLPPTAQAWTSVLVVQALVGITSLIGSNLAADSGKYFCIK